MIMAIHRYIKDKHAKNPIETFRFTIPSNRIKDVDGWSEDWTLEDDAKLLIGVNIYGFGDWISIKEDESLDLGSKIFPVSSGSNDENPPAASSEDAEKLPKSLHLARRADYLLKVLAEQVNIEKSSRKSRGMASKSRSDDYESDDYDDDDVGRGKKRGGKGSRKAKSGGRASRTTKAASNTNENDYEEEEEEEEASFSDDE